jgi:hypothetical protein
MLAFVAVSPCAARARRGRPVQIPCSQSSSRTSAWARGSPVRHRSTIVALKPLAAEEDSAGGAFSLHMSANDGGTAEDGGRSGELDPSEPSPDESPPPPEPYPGFYNDMKRTGLSDADARAQAAKAASQRNPTVRPGAKLGGRKSLLGPDGKPLAPWMRVVEGAETRAPVVPRRGDARGRLAGDPQQQELSGQGLRWRRLGDEGVLSWDTGNEQGNRGFIVSRRRGQEAEWVLVSDWRDKPAELASKGSDGGSYSFVVTDPAPGTWIYRIADEDANGNISDLSQTLVDVEAGDDARVRTIALAVLVVVIACFFGLTFVLDPLSGTS